MGNGERALVASAFCSRGRTSAFRWQVGHLSRQVKPLERIVSPWILRSAASREASGTDPASRSRSAGTGRRLRCAACSPTETCAEDRAPGPTPFRIRGVCDNPGRCDDPGNRSCIVLRVQHAPDDPPPDRLAYERRPVIGVVVVVRLETLESDAKHDLAGAGRPAHAALCGLETFEEATAAHRNVSKTRT